MTEPAVTPSAARPTAGVGAAPAPGPRPLETAELLSIGSELTVGETRDTNAGEIARDLDRVGVRIARLTAVPDRLEIVHQAFVDGLARSDLIVCTGGLGPTPDDLTRESIAAALGETPAVDPELERWLRELWTRRGIDFPTMNLKQAWLIPSATAIPNPNGTAPGWWVDAPDGRVIVALPGPPREMRPMWRDWVLPRLQERGLGLDHVIHTFRLAGIGESAVADLLGETLLRRENPVVATYARVEAVDVRISAHSGPGPNGSPATAVELVEAAEAEVLGHVGNYVWGRDDDTWSAAIGRRLAAAGWALATYEQGTGGSFLNLVGDVPWLRRAEVMSAAEGAAESADDGAAGGPPAIEEHDPASRRMEYLAGWARDAASCQVGLAVEARPHGKDLTVRVAVVTPDGTTSERRLAFMGGPQGRSRAALTAASILLSRLPPEA